jgi:type IV secretion system protein VirB3
MEGSDDVLIQVDPLFVGMTRPATVWGVPYTAVAMESMAIAIIFLAIGNPLYLALVVPVHGVLYLVAASDPGVFDTMKLWATTAGRCVNRRFWGAATFAPGKLKKWES